MWRSAWRLARKEIVRMPLPVVLTILYTLLNSLILGYFISGGPGVTDPHSLFKQKFVVDVFICVFVPNLCFVLTKDYFLYYRNDIFTKKLAFYLKLPIRHSEIVLARYIEFGLAVILFSVVFYTGLYWFSGGLGIGSDPWTFTGVSVLWSGVSLIFSGLYIYLELGYSGKWYFVISLLVAFIYVSACLILNLQSVSLLDSTIAAVQTSGALVPVLSAVVGAAGAYGWAWLTTNRLKQRDFN